MRTQVLDTSIDAYHGIGNAYKATVCDSIYSIVAESKSALSLREIQDKYNRRLKRLARRNRFKRIEEVRFIDVSTVSGRVNELIAANRLERSAPVRKCNFSGKTVHPVSVVPVQLGLV